MEGLPPAVSRVQKVEMIVEVRAFAAERGPEEGRELSPSRPGSTTARRRDLQMFVLVLAKAAVVWPRNLPASANTSTDSRRPSFYSFQPPLLAEFASVAITFPRPPPMADIASIWC